MLSYREGGASSKNDERTEPSALLVDSILVDREQSNMGEFESSRKVSSEDDLMSETETKPNEEDPFDWNTMLDRPFFDPNSVIENQSSNPIMRRLALFVQDDYEKAEVILSGAFICFMIVVSQELVRFQIHGSNYVPFVGGGSPASPF